MNAPQSASEILSNLHEQVEIRAEKLQVDEDDVVSDVLHYYKDPNFDPKKGLRFCIKGKTAIDTGGVLRQIYTDVFIALSESKYGLVLFKGDATRKVPVFSNLHVLTGIFEIIGRLIAHSLIQGVPYLAPIIYSYLSSGDLQTAVLKASYMDVIGQPLHIYIDKIREAKEKDLNDLNGDPDLLQLMQECGERRILTVSTMYVCTCMLLDTSLFMKILCEYRPRMNA